VWVRVGESVSMCGYMCWRAMCLKCKPATRNRRECVSVCHVRCAACGVYMVCVCHGRCNARASTHTPTAHLVRARVRHVAAALDRDIRLGVQRALGRVGARVSFLAVRVEIVAPHAHAEVSKGCLQLDVVLGEDAITHQPSCLTHVSVERARDAEWVGGYKGIVGWDGGVGVHVGECECECECECVCVLANR
jgi:hypothetical protein